jgi:hypothetical protein
MATFFCDKLSQLKSDAPLATRKEILFELYLDGWSLPPVPWINHPVHALAAVSMNLRASVFASLGMTALPVLEKHY